MKFKQINRKFLIVCFVLLSSLAGQFRNVVALSYSDYEPLGNMRTKFLNEVLFPAIERESEGRIKIIPHWNGELSISYKALPTVQEAKDAQIAVVVPEYFMDALPLHQVFKSFPVGATGQEQVNFFRSIHEKIRH